MNILVSEVRILIVFLSSIQLLWQMKTVTYHIKSFIYTSCTTCNVIGLPCGIFGTPSWNSTYSWKNVKIKDILPDIDQIKCIERIFNQMLKFNINKSMKISAETMNDAYKWNITPPSRLKQKNNLFLLSVFANTTLWLNGTKYSLLELIIY